MAPNGAREKLISHWEICVLGVFLAEGAPRLKWSEVAFWRFLARALSSHAVCNAFERKSSKSIVTRASFGAESTNSYEIELVECSPPSLRGNSSCIQPRQTRGTSVRGFVQLVDIDVSPPNFALYNHGIVALSQPPPLRQSPACRDEKSMTNEIQVEKCNQYQVLPVGYSKDSKVGVAFNVRIGMVPLNGLRVSPCDETCGWYIWAGDWSDADDFFQPLHVEHLQEWCPEVMPFLQFPPGWRFLLAPDYEDAWYDPDLEL